MEDDAEAKREAMEEQKRDQTVGQGKSHMRYVAAPPEGAPIAQITLADAENRRN